VYRAIAAPTATYEATGLKRSNHENHTKKRQKDVHELLHATTFPPFLAQLLACHRGIIF
jgi:hypothetical protein